ncbi:hypothetical protein ACFWCA_29495 [Streptomyces phaeochromogenes]|uniref:hypothetical protein n=1 Tax=Streptomyces phaeochromogenes TaxID=1923 RepID=UPI0036836D84
MRTDLPLDALEMAFWRRGIKKGSGLIHHGDRDSQYVSFRYGERLTKAGATASVSSVADSYDKAMAQSAAPGHHRRRAPTVPLPC